MTRDSAGRRGGITGGTAGVAVAACLLVAVVGAAAATRWLLAGAAGPAAAALTALCLASRPAVEPRTFLADWSLAPETALPLAAALVFYLRSAWRGARAPGPAAPAAGQAALFLGGWLLLAVALVSPLCRLAAATASGHMAQHAILVALAPPMLVLGAAGGLARRDLLRDGDDEEDASAGGMGWASVVYGAAIWLAHAPLVYEAALADPAVHLLALAALLGAGLLFWRAVLRRASAGAAMLALLLAMLHTGLLGALLTFAPSPWYPVFAGRAEAWGLTPLEDQQLAGLLMWIPMGGVYMLAALGILARTLGRLADDEGHGGAASPAAKGALGRTRLGYRSW